VSSEALKPWRVEATETLVKDRWIDLRAETCITAEGVTIAPFYILGYPDWAHVVALTPEGRFILVRQWRQAAQMVCLELPGGMIDPGEAPEAAAARELLEETGFAGDQPRPLGVTWANPASHTNHVRSFLITNARPTALQHTDPSERIEVVEAGWDDLPGLIERGEFSQALHIASLMLLQFKHPELIVRTGVSP
jgi:8-oxo-dGTP pyrophosphatase MutT (NUDIX family)